MKTQEKPVPPLLEGPRWGREQEGRQGGQGSRLPRQGRTPGPACLRSGVIGGPRFLGVEKD